MSYELGGMEGAGEGEPVTVKHTYYKLNGTANEDLIVSLVPIVIRISRQSMTLPPTLRLLTAHLSKHRRCGIFPTIIYYFPLCSLNSRTYSAVTPPTGTSPTSLAGPLLSTPLSPGTIREASRSGSQQPGLISMLVLSS